MGRGFDLDRKGAVLNSDFVAEFKDSGSVFLKWTDRRGERRSLSLGRIGPEEAMEALRSCEAQPSVSPKEILKRAEKLEECSDLWIERRRGAGTIFLGYYDAAARQTRHVSLRTSDPAAARRQLYRCADARDEDPRKVLARPRVLSLADVLDLYLEKQSPLLASHVQARIACGHLRRRVGHRHCDHFSYEDSVKLAEALIAEGQSVGSASRILSVLRSALNQAKLSKVIGASPAIHEPRTAAHMEVEPLKGDFLEIDELAALADEALEPHNLTAMVLLLNTAARIGAILDLRQDQIEYDVGLIKLNPAGRLQTKKRRPTLKIPVTLAPWLPERDGNAWIVARNGKRVKSIKTAFRGMRSRAKLPPTVNTYSIRHTLARWMERQRVPDKQISLVLGHVPVGVKRMTLRYTERPESPEYLREATASIEAFVRAVAAKTRKVDLLHPP